MKILATVLKAATLSALALGMVGCAAQGVRHSDVEAESARWEQRTSEPTPASWHTGATWSFVAVDARGEIGESFVFRLTDEPQTACVSGDWKKLEVIRGQALHGPAYIVEGRNLTILLSTAMCDAYPEYSGALSDTGFTGRHHFDHLLGAEEYGAVYGVPVDAERTPVE